MSYDQKDILKKLAEILEDSDFTEMEIKITNRYGEEIEIELENDDDWDDEEEKEEEE